MPTDRTIITAFSEENMVRLTGLSVGQMRAWDKLGFFTPHYAYPNRRAPFSRIYSFKDVVGLRTIAVLMKEYGVSLQELKKVAGELERRGFEHWADVKLYVLKGQVHFTAPGTDTVETVFGGQFAMIEVINVLSDVEARVEKLKVRSDQQIGQIQQQRHVMRNAPVVSGTRIPTATIRRFHEAGYTPEQIIQQYPSLTLSDVHAAIKFEERLAQAG